MGVTDLVKRLRALDVDDETLFAVLEAWEENVPALDERAERRRERDRERKRAMRTSLSAMSADNADVTDSAETPSPSSLSPTPPNPTTPSPKENPPTGVKRKGSRLPEDWQPVPEAAFVEGLSRAEAEREAERFRDYWRSQPGQRGVRADWDATWRNWVRKAVDDRGRGRGADPPKRGSAALAELARKPFSEVFR